MGLTDNAAEENAEKVKETSEANIKNIQEQGKAREELYNLTKDMSNAEIAALEEKLGIEINQNESIYDIKQQTMEQTYAQNQAEMDALSLKKELTEEDKKRMDELFAKQVQLNRDMLANDIARIQAKQKLEADLDKQIEMLQAKQIKGESERAKAMLDIQRKEALSKVEQQIKEAQQTGDTATLAKAQKLKNLIIEDFKRQELEITNKGNAGIAKSTVTSVSNTNKEVKNKYSEALADLRKKNEIAYREAENAGKSEQELRDLKVTQLEAEKTYLTKNLSQIYKKEIDQRDALSKIDNDIKKAKDKTIAEQEKADNERLLNKLERNVVNAKSDIDLFNAEKALLEEQSRQKMLTLEVDSEAALLLADETAKGIAEIDKKIIQSDAEKNLKILAAAQLVQETKLSKAQFELERFKGTNDEQIAQQESFLTTSLATLDAQRITELAALNLSEEEKAAIEEKFRQAKIVAEETTAAKLVEIDDKAREKLNANIEAGFQLATTALSSIGSLQDISTKKKLKGIEKGSKEEEIILKRQFEQQKRMQLAMAVINGAQAIVSIIAQMPKFDGGFATAAAIAGSVIATATSLATIASTSFEGGGSAPAAPDSNSLTGGGTGGMATPNVSLFGSNNNMNNVGAPQDGQGGQNITVNAIVSETQVTDVQNRVNRIQRNAEL
jgi:hypothetical protein